MVRAQTWIVRACGPAALLNLGALHAQSSVLAAPTVAARDTAGHCRTRPLPSVGSTPETGLLFGATVLRVCDPPASRAARPSTFVVYALRSAKQQTRVGIEGERWTTGNARRYAAGVTWAEFPLPYFGIGDRTPDAAREIYTPRGIEAYAIFQQRLSTSWYLNGTVRHLSRTIRTDTTGVLRLGAVTGTRSGPITELSAALIADTRDNLFAPRTGRFVQLSYARSVDGLASNYSYGRSKADARVYHTLAGAHVLAAEATITGFTGSVPFDQMALAGSSEILRGYERGRFRDKWLGAAQGEYRSPLFRRLGGVAFAGAGIVAPSLRAVSRRVLLPTYGVGLRAQLDSAQRTGIRADFGFGRGGASGLYLGFNQAF